jgi:hypothetical protein
MLFRVPRPFSLSVKYFYPYPDTLRLFSFSNLCDIGPQLPILPRGTRNTQKWPSLGLGSQMEL